MEQNGRREAARGEGKKGTKAMDKREKLTEFDKRYADEKEEDTTLYECRALPTF